MQPSKEQLEFIMHNGQYATTDAAGNVVFTSEATPLDDSPDGWEEEGLQFVRNMSWFGVFRSMAVTTFAFKKTARKILLWLFYRFSVQAQADLIFYRRNNDNLYDGYYRGSLDFTQFKHTEYSAEIQAIEGGVAEQIQANRGTTYEIPVDVPEAVAVAWDGIVMYSNTQMLNPVDTIPDVSNQQVPNSRTADTCNLALFLGNGETQYPSVIFNNFTSYVEGDHTPDPQVNWANDWAFRATASCNIKATGTLHARVASTAWYLQLWKYNSKTGITVKTTIDSQTYPDGTPKNVVMDVNLDIDAVDGDMYWIYFEINTDGAGETYTIGNYTVELVGGNLVFNYINDPINFTYTYRHPTTTVKHLRPDYVLKQLMSKMTGGVYSATSSLLQAGGEAHDYTLTCGDAIRGLPGAVLKMSLDDFFKSYNTRFNIGLGTQPAGIIVEKKAQFFQNGLLVDLGPVANAEFTPYNEAIPNNIKIGWPNQENEVGDVNGKEEFNTTVEWTTPITKQAKELDLVSVFRADPFGAEKTRINLAGKVSVDDKSDNDVFMTHIAGQSFTGNATFFTNGVDFQFTVFGQWQSVFPGDTITVSGTASNNGTYTVFSVIKSGITTVTVIEPVVNETAFGMTVTAPRASLNRPQYDSITGITSASSIFNTELRPGLCIRAHGDYLRAGLHTMDSQFLRFQTTDKNANLVVTTGGQVMAEKANILIGSLTGKLFLPILATISVKVPLNIVMLLEVNPYAQIRFEWGGMEYFGFIMKAGQQPAMNSEQTYQLLLSTRVDPLTLIAA